MSDATTLDKLYLEWSNFTKAKTAKDIANEQRIADLEQQLAETQANAAFFRCCALSGEVPKEGAEPFPDAAIDRTGGEG